MELKNIYLNKLRVGTIINIADDLGCPIKYPHIDLNLSGARDNEIVIKENDQKFEDYMNAIID